MDTRGKILDRAALADAIRDLDGVRVVTGHFDPMLAAHARRLAAARNGARSLVVLITEPDEPLLDARARAELVAALDAVDHVGIATSAMIASIPAGSLQRMEDDDLRDRARLVHLARDKQ